LKQIWETPGKRSENHQNNPNQKCVFTDLLHEQRKKYPLTFQVQQDSLAPLAVGADTGRFPEI
jgi:hypothetical protein